MGFIEDFSKAIEGITDFRPHMFGGASEEELSKLEKELGFVLPDDFKEFYQIYNGQDEYADALFDIFYLCTVEQIISYWDALKSNESEFMMIRAESDIGIKEIWGCSKWVPFASTADGHCLCMDFAPTEAGTVGQVITFWYNSPERELIAPSFKDFILEYVKNIQEGVYIYEQDDDKEISMGMIVRKDGEPMFGT